MKKIFLLMGCLSLAGCVYNQYSKEQHQGTRIEPQQVAAIELGKTNRQWVLTNFGIPERTQSDKDGLEIFEYVSDSSNTSEKTLIFLFKIKSEKNLEHKVTRVVLRNGIVESVVANEE